MKKIILILAVMTLTACGTIGGAADGFGEDIKRVGNASGDLVSKGGQYIKKVGN